MVETVPVEAFTDIDCRNVRLAVESMEPSQAGNLGFEDLKAQLEVSGIRVGIARLSDILDNGHSETSARRHAKMVVECYHRRLAISTMKQVAQNGCNLGGENISDWRESALQTCTEVLQYDVGDVVPVEVTDVMVDVLDRQRQIHLSGLPPGSDTGYDGLTRMIGGWKKGQLCLVAARPSMGKTAFALCSARKGTKHGAQNLFVSLEMPLEDLVSRIIAQVSGYPTNKLGQHFGDVYDRLVDIGSIGLHVLDIPAATVEMISSYARSFKSRNGGLDVLWVDYLGLISVAQNLQSREREVSFISRSLKSIAKNLDCCVVALSQLNRQLESRPNKRPMLADLRGSGSLEQDADVIIFIYRDIMYDREADPMESEINVAKNRTGETGTIGLLWDSSTTRFDNVP
jgi:replicative DNA helicase